MTSHKKNNESKKFMFKEVSNPLFPISNKMSNNLNYYSAIKLNLKPDLNKHIKKLASNDINSTNIQYKKLIENASAIKTKKEINKTYSSTSRPKEENSNIIQLNNSKLSKIKPLDFSANINNSAISEKYKKNNNNNQKRALLSASKLKNKTNIDLDAYSPKEFKNNINIISPSNLGTSQIFNNNKNNIYSLRKPNINNKNIIGINNSNSNSYYNNIIINNNSSTNINTNFNLINTKKPNNNYYLKTDMNNNIGTTTPKESNVRLIFNNKNLTKKKLEDPPIILKRKDSSLPLANTNPDNKLKYSIDKNIFNGEYKLHLKKTKKNYTKDNNYLKKNEKIIIDDTIKKKKNNIKGPEDLHFYYIQAIQEGKKTELDFEKD